MPHFLFYLRISISSSSLAKLTNLILLSLRLPRVSAAEQIKLILSDDAVHGAVNAYAEMGLLLLTGCCRGLTLSFWGPI